MSGCKFHVSIECVCLLCESRHVCVYRACVSVGYVRPVCACVVYLHVSSVCVCGGDGGGEPV